MKRAALALVPLLMIAAPQLMMSQERGASRAETRRVLVIGAHPDDEDTQLISWLQRGGRAETAYLSLTRGDGGQNLIGNELGEALGIIRTEELLAARRVDGAHQYFTRAYDFGYSKNAAETFAHWPKDSLLNDVVTVVRAFKPHVIVSIF
ncbi:MAG: PIG-L family deacetylase, partial [Gemmatimonadaceae bacterium]|nr:PIG-L family deacetylase [Gemmatimonadaceae bacterium]